MAELDGVVLDEESFVGLLGRLIGEAKYLQNNPPELTPCEDRGEEALTSCSWLEFVLLFGT
jgi:hypothetical protein